MGSAPVVRDALREKLGRHDPGLVIAFADIEAWDRAEGPSSDAAAAAVRRKDFERLIPGLPARRTYMVLGCVTLVAVVLDSALAWLPESGGIDELDTMIRFGTAGIGLMAAAWSLLSEVRGWDGSDASTWFRQARIKRHEKTLAARRQEMSDIVVAVGPERLVVYRHEGGVLSHETFTPDAVLDLALETGSLHMTLRLTTRAESRCFDWLRTDAALEAAVDGFVGSMLGGKRAAEGCAVAIMPPID